MNYTEHLKYLENLLGGNSLDLSKQYSEEPQGNLEFLTNWENYLSNPILATPSLVDEKNPGAYVRYLENMGEYQDKVKELYLQNPETPYDEILKKAAESTIYARDEKTNQFIHPEILDYHDKQLFNYEMLELNKLKKDRFDVLNNLFTHYDDFDSEADDDNEMFLKLKKFLSGKTSEDKLKQLWNDSSPEERKGFLLNLTGRELYDKDSLLEFMQANDEDREQMLANSYVVNPYYNKDNPWEVEKKASETIKNTALGAINKYLIGNENIEEAKEYYSKSASEAPWYRIDRILGGFGLDLLTSGVEAVENIAASGILYGAYKVSSSKNEDLDKRVRTLQSNYIDRKSNEWVDYWRLMSEIPNSGISLEGIAEKIDQIAREVSPEFKLNEGNQLTHLGDTEEDVLNAKVKLMAEYMTERLTNGEKAAVARVLDFYKNLAESRQTKLDVAANSGVQFANNMLADGLSFAAVIGTAFYTAGGLIGEGYTDELMHNRLMQKANGLLETGAWNDEEQQKYREAGLNKYLIYKSAEEERSMFSSKLPAELFGQYGFTAATTLLSLVEGLALRGITKVTGGRVARKFQKGFVRGQLKLGLLSPEAAATKLELLNSSEHLASLVAKDRVWGGMFAGGLLGTAEGGLEATATYNNYRKSNLQPFFNNGEGYIDLLIALVENAPNEAFIPYMASTLGFTKDFREGWVNKNRLQNEFTQEDYDKARAQVLKLINEVAQDLKNRVEDDALDAAAANFMLNSAINGLLKVTLEASFLAGDVRKSVKAFKGERPLTDFIDVRKNSSGVWEAFAKKEVRNSWKELARHPIQAIKNPLNVAVNTIKGTVKGSFGEGLEEYSQGISDNISREAMQADMEGYLKVLFNDEAREAFSTDYGDILFTGLNGLGAQLSNIENIKEGVYGFLSTLFGGASPGRFILQTPTYVAEAYNRKDGSSAISAYGKAILKSLGSLYDGSFINNYREFRDDADTSTHLLDAINTWLLNKDAQELMTHMGGAVGFEKSLMESVRQGDEYEAHNNKLGLAIENISMLESLRGTKFYEGLRADINKRLHLGEDILDGDDTEGEHYDSQGKYKGSNNTILDILSLFKNQLGSVSRSMDMSDKQIIERVRKNAQEFMDLRDRVLNAETRIKSTFLQKNVDPLVLKTLSYAIISSEDAKDRKDKIEASLTSKKENVRRGYMGRKSGLSKSTIDAILRYGSIRKIKEHIKSLDATIAELRAAKKYAYATMLENSKQRLTDIVEQALNEIKEGGTTTLTDDIVFSVADMLNMDLETLSNVIIKGKNGELSKSLVAEIDKLLDTIEGWGRLDILEEKNPEALRNAFIDWKALSLKSESYNNYLADYIKNPSWLESTAFNLRLDLRYNSLKFIYKDLFQIKADETAQDMLKRVDEKINQLRALGKLGDAEILEKIKKNNIHYKNYTKAMSDINNAVLSYIRYSQDKNKEAIGEEVTALLKTLVLNGGLSYKEVTDLIEENNADKINSILNRNTLRFRDNVGKLLKEGETLELFSERVINECRNVINVAKDVEKQKQGTKVVGNSERKNPQAPSSGVVPPPPNVQGQEPVTLKVTTFGDIDSNKHSEIYNYLKSNNVDKNAEDFYTNSGNRKISLKAVKIGNAWVVIVCNQGKPIGILEDSVVNSSTLLKDKINQAIKDSTGTEVLISTTTLADTNGIEINNVNNLVPTREASPETELPVITNETLQLSGLTLDNFLDHIVLEETSNGWGFFYAKDKDRYPIRVKHNSEGQTVSIFELKDRNGRTVNDILKSSLSSKEKIEALKDIAPIKYIIDRWINYKPDGVTNPIDVYNNLIGDFIYLGRVKRDAEDRGDITVTRTATSDNKPVITLTKRVSTVKFGAPISEDIEMNIPIPQDNTILEEKENLFLNFLSQENETFFKEAFVLLSAKVIPKTGLKETAYKTIKDYAKILLTSGLIQGQLPGNYKITNLLLANPFLPKGQGKKIQGGTNNLGDPQFNPPPAGAKGPGGITVDTVTEKPLTGNAASIKKEAKNYIDKLLNDKLEKIKSLLTGTGELSGDGAYYVLNKNGYARATHVIAKLIGEIGKKISLYKEGFNKLESKEETSSLDNTGKNTKKQTGTQATAFGNIVDDLTREICLFLNAYLSVNEKGLPTDGTGKLKLKTDVLDHIKLTFEADNYISSAHLGALDKHLSLLSAKNLVEQIYKVYLNLSGNGFIIIPNDVTVYGLIPVVNADGSTTNKAVRTAGTLDILAYNPNTNEIVVVDIKSTLGNDFTGNKGAYWTGLLATYKELIVLTLKRNNVDVSNIKISCFNLPIKLTYTVLKDVIVNKNGRTVTGKDGKTLLSFVIEPTNGLTNNGLLDKTSEVDKVDVKFDSSITEKDFIDKLFIVESGKDLKPLSSPTANTNEDAPKVNDELVSISKEKDKDKTGQEGEKPKRRGITTRGLRPKKSVRTEVLAALTDFINNRIAPLKTFKVAIVSTIFSYIRKYLEKSNIRKAIENDLAITFFNGDVLKLRSIAKVKITASNANIIRLRLINYFSAYVSQRESYELNLILKHTLIQALYNYIDGTISLEEFDNTLETYSMTASSISEYVEYLNAEDREAAGREIKVRLLEQELYSKENLLKRTQDLKLLMDDMAIKLEFLLRENSAQMLSDRINSVETALVTNQLEYKSYNLNGTIKDMMSGRKHFFKARSVLEEIVRKSRTRYMKVLAQSVLEALDKDKDLVIEVVNNENNTVEGEFSGRLIRIGKNSLNSYERLERVILHETIHAVVENNPQVRERLDGLLQQVIEELKYETGKSEEQIRQDTYGLSNVDEFISEFFTNFAFQESLKLIADTNTRYDNIFDSILGAIKNFFKKDVTLWNRINSAMQDVLAVQNTLFIKQINKQEKQEIPSEYDKLSNKEKAYLQAGGISAFDYNHLTRLEKEFIRQCCS